MPILSEQFQLSTRNTMVHETPYDPSVRQRTEEEDDDLGENNDTAEIISEYSVFIVLQYPGVRS